MQNTAIADPFDDAKGEYVGLKLGKLVEVNLNSEMVLVRREVAEAQISKQAPQLVSQGDSGSGTTSTVHAWPQPKLKPGPGRAASMQRSHSIPIVRRRQV